MANNLPDPDNRYLLSIAREMQSSARSLGELAERLSNNSMDKFVEHLKEVMKQQKLITDADKEHIKDMKTLSGVLHDIEKDREKYSKIFDHKVQKQYDNLAKRTKNKPKYQNNPQRLQRALDKLHENMLKKQAKIHGLSDEYFNALQKNVDVINDEITARKKAVSGLEGLGKEAESLGRKLKGSVKNFFTWDNAFNLAKQSFFKNYEQMSSLTEKGMLGAIHTINIVSLKLRMLPKELEDLLNRNRDIVNQFGGGIEGVKGFAEYFNQVQSDLGHLGPHMKVAAERFIQLNKQLGYNVNLNRMSEDQQNAAIKSMMEMKKQYTTFAALFGDTPDMYYNLIASQLEEEHVRNRLNSATGKNVAQVQKEIMTRTENLKLLGLSNDQIVKFNEKISALYDPRKDNRVQRAEDAIRQMNAYKFQMDALLRSSDPDDLAAGEAMQNNQGAMWKFLRAKMSNTSIRSLNKMKNSDEFLKASAAMYQGGARMENLNQSEMGAAGYAYSQLRPEALDEIEGVGKMLVESIRKGTAAIPKELAEQMKDKTADQQLSILMNPDNRDLVKTMGRDFLFKDGGKSKDKIEEAKVLEAQYTAITEVTNALNNSLVKAISAAVAALGTLAATTWAAAAANTVLAGKAGIGGLLSTIGGFAKSGIKILGLLGSALAVFEGAWKWFSSGKDYDSGAITEVDRNTQRGEGVGGAVGAVGGGVLGAMATGAITGTALGTAFPVAGNIIGGIVGAGVGIGGYYLGKNIGGSVGSKFGEDKKKDMAQGYRGESVTEKQEPKAIKPQRDYRDSRDIAEDFSVNRNLKGMNIQQTKAYAGNTAYTESRGKLNSENKYGYIGQYQFGADALADSGLVDKQMLNVAKSTMSSSKWWNGGQAAFLNDPKNWTIDGGKKAFLSDREMQDKAFVSYTNSNIARGIKSGAISEDSDPAKIAAYAKAAHLKGAGAANNYFLKNIDSMDANGTRVSDYARDAYNSMRQISGTISPDINKPDIQKISNREVTGKIKQAPMSPVSPDETPLSPSLNPPKPKLATPSYTDTPQQPLPDMVPRVQFETLPRSAVQDPAKNFTQNAEEQFKKLIDAGVPPERIGEEMKKITTSIDMPPTSSVKTVEQRQQETAQKQKADEQKRASESGTTGNPELDELKKHTDLLASIARSVAAGRAIGSPTHQRDKTTILNGLG